MKLCDMHCDTATAIYYGRKKLASNDCAVSLEKAAVFDKYLQLAAIFTSPRLGDEEGWGAFLGARRYFLDECAENGVHVLSSSGELAAWDRSDSRAAFILTVEDARILAGKLERVEELYRLGVRVMTLLWGGETIIGGSHNTDTGLTDFGRAAVREMLNVGIIPDVSHASFRSTDEILDLCESAGKAPVATHMNAHAVCGHSRNLTDGRFQRLVKLGGCAGVSLCPPHLAENGAPTTSADAARHLLHYRALAPDAVGFGCDLDGTELPDDLPDLSALPVIAGRLRESGLKETEIEEIYYGNVFRFLKDNLPE